MGNREDYLNDPFGRVENSDHDRVVPEYLVREATSEEDWEASYKASLEISSFGNQFRQKFLEDYKIENRQTIQVWRPEAAAEWLQAKCKAGEGIDKDRANQILTAAGAIDEKRTEVLSLMQGDDSKPPKKEEGSPTKDFKKFETPRTTLDVDREKMEKAKKDHKSKKVGSYAIVLTEDVCQLYRQGSKVAEVSPEDYGGFDVLASEIDELGEDKVVEAFFALHQEQEETPIPKGWLAPVAKVVDPTEAWKPAIKEAHAALEDASDFLASFDTAKEVTLFKTVVTAQKLDNAKIVAKALKDFVLYLAATEKTASPLQIRSKEALNAVAQIFDDPAYQRLDQQKADSGAFDPKNVDQSAPERDMSEDPGPASAVPGARTPVAPQLPLR